MRYFINISLVIAFAVAANFIIKDNDAMLLMAIGTIIAGFWYAVFSIVKHEELRYAKTR
ncbi:MAG: hypothetical protein OQK48_08115 [Sulfurimonas sp.]|uniref:hypothetical protein n=1 Tax=Sulfurimonas sp. TaxID=2022749 RepID=UPI00262A565A|nr:hypothetical protein [Sulfurimonas sp.]MCW8895828.1 hypothetical protein [Sulfurimonas sp.]MCW8954898.1 hypothetical protein [Sulfurimonas sp.]